MRLLRSLLFVPADSPRKMEKARTLRPDALIFDLEDAVALDRKLQARDELQREMESLANPSMLIFVRVNESRSEWFAGDLGVAVSPAVDTIVLPKCDTESEIVRADEEIAQLEAEKGIARGRIKLHLIVETALGVVRSYELARASERVIALNFGAEDYCADMGIQRTRSGEEVMVARSFVAQAAHAARVEAIDTVFTDFHDEAGLIEETRRARQMGFTGKALIHPSQIDPVHQAFAPSEEERARAAEVVKAFEEARVRGSGVIVVRGKMVDEPVVQQARRILDRGQGS